MVLRKFADLRAELPSEVLAKAEEKTDEFRIAIRLDEIRRKRRITQKEIGDNLKIAQPSVSKMTKQHDMYLSTLTRIIEAMGGKLDISVNFPDGASYRLYESVTRDEPAFSRVASAG